MGRHTCIHDSQHPPARPTNIMTHMHIGHTLYSYKNINMFRCEMARNGGGVQGTLGRLVKACDVAVCRFELRQTDGWRGNVRG